jgi:hypothetical protein
VTDPEITPGTMIRLVPDAVFREECDGFLLYDIRRDILFEGNVTGTQILMLCDGRRTVGEIAAILADSSGSPQEEIFGHTVSFLSSLMEHKMVECTDEPPVSTG